MVTSYLRAARRRWYLIAAALLLALGILVLSTHDSFIVVARVIVPTPAGQTTADFQGIAESQTVARAVEFDLRINGESPERLLQQVSVTHEPGSDIYDISIHDTSRARALRLCDAWVTEADALYAKLNTAPAALAYSDAVQQLTTEQQQINTLQQQIVAFEYAHPELVNMPVTTTTPDSRGTTVASGRRSTSDTTSTQTTNRTPGSLQNALYLANLQQQLTSDQTMYTQLAQAIGTTQAQALQSERQASAEVLDPGAVAPINLTLWTALAVVLGLLLGLGLVALWERFDHSLRSSAPLERAFGTQAIVSIAARPSARELWRVAPVDWAQPALPPATSRAGRWPVATYALAAVAAARPHTSSRQATDNAPDALAGPQASGPDAATLVAHDGHANGHANGHRAFDGYDEYDEFDEFDEYDGREDDDALDEPAFDGHQP